MSVTDKHANALVNRIPLNLLFLFLACATWFGQSSHRELSGYTQAVKSDAEQARTSFDAFAKAIDKYSLSDVPFSKTHVGELIGERVSSDAAIMKRFGGRVEFEGVFYGVVTTEDSPGIPQKKSKKIDISMAWPTGLSSNSYRRLHLYPKAGSLKAWRALKPQTSIKFRAVVTGITMYYPYIPNVHAFSILLEEGEIVSK